LIPAFSSYVGFRVPKTTENLTDVLFLQSQFYKPDLLEEDYLNDYSDEEEIELPKQ
jgi:hypothetical protein